MNPRVIYGTIKGFNEDSPFAVVKAFEPVAQCAGGAASTTGWWTGEYNIPTQSGAALGDSNTGMHLVIGLLAALLQREQTGEGCFVQQSMQDTVLNLCRIKLRDQLILERTGVLKHLPEYPGEKFGNTVPRAGNVEGGQVLGWCYRCKGWETDPNAFVYIVLQNESKPFAAACNALGKPEWITDPKFNTPEARNQVKEEIYKGVEEYTITRDKYEVVDVLGKAGVPCGPVLSMYEIARDQSLLKCGTLVEVDQPKRGKFLTIGCLPKFSSYTPQVTPAPLLGADTDAILQELGYAADQIEQLRTNYVMFDNFKDCYDFVDRLIDNGVELQSVDCWLDSQYPDSMITYSKLSNKIYSFVRSKEDTDIVIAPFSEIARFYNNNKPDIEFDTLISDVKTIEASHQAYENRQRVYIPIVGLEAKMSKFYNDSQITVWHYKNPAIQQNYHLILTEGTTYGVKRLENNYSVVSSVSEWLRLWRDQKWSKILFAHLVQYMLIQNMRNPTMLSISLHVILFPIF